MPELVLPLTAFSIRSARPSQKYGVTNPLPVSATEAVMLRLPLGQLPRDATVLSAALELTEASDRAASATLDVARNTGVWTSSVTWESRGGTASAGSPLTKATGNRSTLWSFDVGTTVQDMVAGVIPNRGLRVFYSAGTSVRLRGSNASSLKPRLRVSYTLAPPAPTGLRPSAGAVGVAKPVLRFDAADDITAAQVQIDGPPGDSSPEFDSGTYATVAGQVRLADTAYAGLSNGDSKVWRVRQRNDHGWSRWSSWYPLVRLDKGTSTLLNPVASVEDPTPPFEWTAPSIGTQVAWRARLLDATGKVLDSSGRTSGTGTTWTPERGFTYDGQAATAEVLIWTDADREGGPGDPVTIKLTRDLTFNLDPSVDPMDNLMAVQSWPYPGVLIQGSRAVGTPDQAVMFRDGRRITPRMVGTDVFDGVNFAWWDHTATMNTQHTYRAAPIVGGKTAKGGPVAAITPTCSGIWLIDEDDPTRRVAIWGDTDAEQTAPEQAILHVPVSTDGAVEVVRRRMVRLPAQGSVAGTLVNALGVDASTSEGFLREFAEDDPGHLYRLVLGRQNLRVIVGDIEFSETPLDSRDDRVLGVSLNWWARERQG